MTCLRGLGAVPVPHFCLSEPPSPMELSPSPPWEATSPSAPGYLFYFHQHFSPFCLVLEMYVCMGMPVCTVGQGVALGWELLRYRGAFGSDRLDSNPILPTC